MTFVAALVLVAILAKWAAQLWLDLLNQRHVLARADAVPEAFKNTVDEATYARSIQYTLARSRLSRFDDTYQTLILLAALFSGALPCMFGLMQTRFGHSAWSLAACMSTSACLRVVTSANVTTTPSIRLSLVL